MQRNNANKTVILATASLVLLVFWLVSAITNRSVYQNIAGVDSLAMINVLFPWFWILLLAFAVICIAVFRLGLDTAKWLHALLLVQLSLFLFFTPFILSGFSWSPDSLWHGGVASYMPEILSGSKPAYSGYAQSYPLSFLTTYCVEQVSGLDVFSYTLYVYPLVCITSITMLAYVFASRLLSPRQAFVSMLLALPALHFLEPHVSPFSAGTVLVLVSFILLTVKGRAAKVLSFFTIFALILTHPISPISLGIFLFAAAVLSLFSKTTPAIGRFPFKTSVLASILLFLGTAWFAWTTLQVASIYETVEYALLDVFTLRFLDRLGNVLGWTAGGQSFIYPGIHQLNLSAYVVFLLFVSLLLLLDLTRRFAWKRIVTDNRARDGAYERIPFVAFSSLIYAAFGYMLFLATDQRFLLGRGLIFYIFMASIYISKHLVRRNQIGRDFKEFVVVSVVLFLLFSFPIISYSKEAYNTFTPSAAHGLTFVSQIDLSRKSVSMSFDQQLAAYVNLSEVVLAESYPPNLNTTSPDFVVLRTNAFFYSAMRGGLSFERNSYTELQDDLRGKVGYNKIYSSPTFEVYSSSID